MYLSKVFNKKDRDNFNTEGLSHLYWELFDSADAVGSAFRYIEREPVLILDDIIKEHQYWRPFVLLGYTSQPIANLLGLPTSSSFRVGKAVRLRAKTPQKRMFIVENLIIRGVTRIAVCLDYVEFDTDNYLKKPSLYIH
tara:strand:- start:1062 stop:1478 length:417 start_codon:yes stop_codon:yes gene_type:complete